MVRIDRAFESGNTVEYFGKIRRGLDILKTLKQYPVDLFIGIIEDKGQLVFFAFNRTFESKLGISRYTTKQINEVYTKQLKRLLGNYTINQGLSNQNCEFGNEVEVGNIAVEGKHLYENIIPEEIKSFLEQKLNNSLFLSIDDEELVNEVVQDLREGHTEKLKERLEKKQPTGRLTITANKARNTANNDRNWEILEELNRDDIETYYAYIIKKEDGKLNVYRTIDSVWINCEQSELEPFWELFYTRLQDGEEFFWGERFSLAKVPAAYDFPELQIQIDDKIKVAIIRDEEASAKEEENYLNSHSEVNLAVIVKGRTDIQNAMGKTPFNIMHIAAHYVNGKLLNNDDKINLGEIGFHDPTAHIVFMNTCDTQSHQICFIVPTTLADEFKNKKGWIGTNWTILGPPASDFAKCFYDNFLHGIPIARSVKEARKKIRDTNIMYLAYTVYGHPFTRLVRV